MLEVSETSQFVSGIDDTNNIRNIWRPTFLQFVAMDCIILKEWNVFKYWDNVVDKSDPYRITLKDIHHIQQKINPNYIPKESLTSTSDNKTKESLTSTSDNKTKESVRATSDNKTKESVRATSDGDELRDIFKRYVIALNIQRILSFVLIDTRKIYDLKFLPSTDLDIESSSLYATRDKIDKQVTGYYRDIENKKIINTLQDVNEGLPIPSEYEEVFQSLVNVIGDLSNRDTDIILGDDDGAFAMADVLGKGTRLEEILINHIFGNPHEDYPDRDLSKELISKCGMQDLFNKLQNMLPSDPIDIINSSIFINLLEMWKQLFDNPTPEILGELIDIIPNIGNRFRIATTNSDTQADLWGGAIRLMTDFLSRSASPIRIKELVDLREKPLAGHCLTNFRSLLAISKSHLNGDLDHFYPQKDNSGRINWLMIIYWALTDTRELGMLFRYAYNAEPEDRLTKYDLPKPKDKPGVIPAAMFPGSYDLESSSTAGSSLVLTGEYEKEKKEDDTVFKMLRRTGGREKALRSEGGRGWYP